MVSTDWKTKLIPWLAPRWLPGLLVCVGLALAAWIGARSNDPKPPSFSETAVITLASSALSIAGGAAYGRIGRIEPGHARSAVRRLFRLGRDVRGMRAEAIACEPFKSEEMLAHVISRLEGIEGVVVDAIADWNDVHPEALTQVMEREPDG
jgi:hypothetical protein